LKKTTISFDLVWADNADVISLQYAGTGALKTDYTRLVFILRKIGIYTIDF
jgi:hypothetical protein